MKPFLLLLFAFQLSCCFSQTWQWGIRGGAFYNTGGTGQHIEETVVDMTLDNAGNTYAVTQVNGDSYPTVTGYPGTVGGYGYQDILLVSYSCNGSFRWKKIIGGGMSDAPQAIGTDTLGHIYIVGAAGQPEEVPFPVTQPPAVHFDTDSTIPFSNYKYLFVARYDTSGALNWIRWIAPDSVSRYNQNYGIRDMIVSKDGRIDMLGWFQKGIIGGGASSWVADSSRSYILSYDKNGNIINLVKPDIRFRMYPSDGYWVTNLPNIRMAKMNNGKFIVAGLQNLYTSSPPFDTLRIGDQLIPHSAFVACFDSNWHMLWKAENNDTYANNGFAYRPVLDDQSNIYLVATFFGNSGYFNGTSLVNTLGGAQEPYAVKLDSLGHNVWLKCSSSIYANYGHAIALSSNGILYVTGEYVWLNWDGFHLQNPSNSNYDIFLAGLNANTGAVVSLDSLKGTFGYYDQTSVLAADKKGNVYVGGYMGYNLKINSSSTIVSAGDEDFFLVKYGTSNCSNGPVPVTLTSFTAVLQDKVVLCRWQTQQEVNTDRFVVQRSTDGSTFTGIGIVGAAGNSNRLIPYDYTDNTPFEAVAVSKSHVLYYRLKMLDKDGRFSYSTIQKVLLPQGKETLNVYPNPVSTSAFITYRFDSNTKHTIALTDMSGHTLTEIPVTALQGSFILSTAAYSNGIYQLVAKENGAIVKTVKVVVAR